MKLSESICKGGRKSPYFADNDKLVPLLALEHWQRDAAELEKELAASRYVIGQLIEGRENCPACYDEEDCPDGWPRDKTCVECWIQYSLSIVRKMTGKEKAK